MRFLRVRYRHCPAFYSCIFSAIGENDRCKVTQELHYVSCHDGEIVFQQGEQVRGLYILCQGRVKLRLVTQEGRNFLVRICTPGELLAGITLHAHAFSAISAGASTMCFINRPQAVQLIEQYPSLGLEVDRRFAQEGALLLQRMADLAYASIEERLAHILLSLGRRHGVPEEDGLRIDLSLSQLDLAEMIGASRQAVNRELRKLADQGLIQVERCRITILDDEDLRNLR